VATLDPTGGWLVQDAEPAGRTRHRSATVLGLGVAVIVATAVPFRGLASGLLIGGVVDARWTVALHEHWYRWLHGLEGLTSTLYYFPAPDTVGLSDAFLLQGLVHSGLRTAGMSPVDAWSATGVLLVLAGNVALALLSLRILQSLPLRIVFVIAAGTSYAFVAQLVHPQTAGYALVAWLALLLVVGWAGPPPRTAWAWCLVPPLWVLLALSAWYAAVFTLLLGVLAVLLAPILFPVNGLVAHARRRLLTIPRWLAAACGVATVGLAALWAVVYLPVAGETTRDWYADGAPFAPQLSDFVNVTSPDGGIWDPLMRAAALTESGTSVEQRLGLTPVLVVAFLVASVAALASVSRRPSRFGRLQLWSALIIVTAIVLVVIDGRSQGLWRLVWAWVPGGSSVRAPMRIMVILTPLVLVVVLRALERLVLGRTGRPRVAALVLVSVTCVALVVEQQRPAPAGWTAQEFVPVEYTDASVALVDSGCEAFFLVPPDGEFGSRLAARPDGAVATSNIDAVAIAVQSGIPTLNGNAARLPLAYPAEGGYVADVTALLSWARALKPDTAVCVVDAHGAVERAAAP
jgi:hypothetical protein